MPLAGKKNQKTSKEAGVQEHFIARLRQALPPGLGLAEEMAEILGVSTDSAYRRIRGETGLTLEEIFRISARYPLSIDDLFNNRGDTVTFAYTKLTDSATNFETYLGRIHSHLQAIGKFEEKKIYYVAEEVPIFYSFHSPIFTDFKLFYWQRSVLNCAEYQQGTYEPGLIPSRLIDLAGNCFKEYLKIPSVEVWTDLTVLTGLRQVGYYYESGVMNREITLKLLHEYRSTIEMVRRNAEAAKKNPHDPRETFQLYNSEVVLGTNCIYILMGESKHSYISFNTLNSLTTSNPEFCQETEHWMRNLERKSTLISGVAEKQRYQFFSSMFKKIDEQIERTAAG